MCMYVKATTPNNPLVHLAKLDDPLHDVSMNARVGWFSGAKDYGVSFTCRYQSPANYYVLAVLSDPWSNIVRYRNRKPISLTGGIKPTDAVNKNANQITAKCVGDQPTILTLQANGQTIGTAKDDDGIESGNIGVRVGSSEILRGAFASMTSLKYL